MKEVEKNVILNEVKKGLNFKEKIIINLFPNIFVKVYNICRINIINKMIK